MCAWQTQAKLTLCDVGFGQAAKRLERDWGLQRHPDDLPFAKYIGPRGLISLIQYGLKLRRIQASERPVCGAPFPITCV